jgi:hypothetical protein
LIALVTLFFALLYSITTTVLLSKYLTWLHVTIVILSYIAFIAFLFQRNETTRSYIDVSAWDGLSRFNVINKITSRVFLFFILGQFVLVVNIVGGMIKGFGRH